MVTGVLWCFQRPELRKTLCWSLSFSQAAACRRSGALKLESLKRKPPQERSRSSDCISAQHHVGLIFSCKLFLSIFDTLLALVPPAHGFLLPFSRRPWSGWIVRWRAWARRAARVTTPCWRPLGRLGVDGGGVVIWVEIVSVEEWKKCFFVGFADHLDLLMLLPIPCFKC